MIEITKQLYLWKVTLTDKDWEITQKLDTVYFITTVCSLSALEEEVSAFLVGMRSRDPYRISRTVEFLGAAMNESMLP